MSSPSQLADFYRKDQIFQMEDRLNQLNNNKQQNQQNTAAAGNTPIASQQQLNNNASVLHNTSVLSTNTDMNMNNTSSALSLGGASPLPNNNNNQLSTPSGSGTAQLYLGRRSPTLDPQQPPSYEAVPPANTSRLLSRKEAAAARQQQQQQQNSTPTPATAAPSSQSPKQVSSFNEYEKEISKMGGQILPAGASPNNQQQQQYNQQPNYLDQAIQQRTQAEKAREAELAREKEAAELRKKIRDAERKLLKHQQKQQQEAQAREQGSAHKLSGAPARSQIDLSVANQMALPFDLHQSQLPENTNHAKNRAEEICKYANSPFTAKSNVAVSADVDFRSQGGSSPAASPASQYNSNNANDFASIPSAGNFSNAAGEFASDNDDNNGGDLLSQQPSLAIDFDNVQGVGAIPNIPNEVPQPTKEIIELMNAQAKPNAVLVPKEVDAGDIFKEIEKRQLNQTPREVAAIANQQNRRVSVPFAMGDLEIMVAGQQKSDQSNPNSPAYVPKNSNNTKNRAMAEYNNNNNTYNSNNQGSVPRLPLSHLQPPTDQQIQQQKLAENNTNAKDHLSKYMEQALGYGSQPPTPRSTASSAPPIQISKTALLHSSGAHQQQDDGNNLFVQAKAASKQQQQANFAAASKNNNNNTGSPNSNMASDQAPPNFSYDGNNNNYNYNNNNHRDIDQSSSVAATGQPSPAMGVSQVPSGKTSNYDGNTGSSQQQQNAYYHSSGTFAFGKVPNPAHQNQQRRDSTTSQMLKQQEQDKNKQLAQKVQALKHQLEPLGSPQPANVNKNQEMPPDADDVDTTQAPLGGSPQPRQNNNNNSNSRSASNAFNEDTAGMMNTMALVELNQEENEKSGVIPNGNNNGSFVAPPLGRSDTQNPLPPGNNNINDQDTMGEQRISNNFGLQQQQQLSAVENYSASRAGGGGEQQQGSYGEQSSPGRLIRRLHESERQRLALVREVEALKTDLKESIEQQSRMSGLPGSGSVGNAAAQALMRNAEKSQNRINASRFDPNNMNENVIVRVRSTDAAEGDGAQWAAEIDEEEQARTRAQQVMTEMLRAIDARKAAEARLQSINAENERLRTQNREAQQRESKLHQMLTQYQQAFESWRSTWTADQNNGENNGGGLGGGEVVLGKSAGLSSVRVQILESRVEALTKENEQLRSEMNVQGAKRKAQDEAEAARAALRGNGSFSSGASLGITSTAGAATLRRRGTDQETDVLVRMFELQRQNEGLQRNINDMKIQNRRY